MIPSQISGVQAPLVVECQNFLTIPRSLDDDGGTVGSMRKVYVLFPTFD